MAECSSLIICDSTSTSAPSTTSTSVGPGDTSATSTSVGTGDTSTTLAGTGDTTADGSTTTTVATGDAGTGIGAASLEAQAEQSTAAAAQSLSDRLSTVGEPVELDVMGLEAPMNAFAAALVAVGMTVALFAIGVRNWKTAWKVPTRFFRYALISAFSVAVSLGLWDITLQISEGLVVIPDKIEFQGDLWSGPFAGITLPAAEVLLDAQPYVVGILIAALPLAAAISMFSAYERLVWVVMALVVANIVWLPFFVVLISRLFVETDAANAAWWSLVACLCAVGANSLALAGIRSKED